MTEHKQRRTLDDIAREALRDMNLSLQDQVTVSLFYTKVRAAFEDERKQREAES